MKNIARIALQPGMVIAADIHNPRNNEVMIPAGTKVDTAIIRKLNVYSIVVVSIMEDLDYATTYYEKTRLSPGFIKFNEAYEKTMTVYKASMMNFIDNKILFPLSQLMQMYYELVNQIMDNDKILDYFYNMLPSEDDMTHAHCLNSALIAGVFGSWLGLSVENTQILIQCAFCYDIGKLKLPNALLWKPGKLTDVEFMRIKTHTMVGFDMLKDMPLNQHILKATLMHHERCDGTGYPSKLKDAQIDTFAKLIAIIDSYEAMTSPRIYRESKHPFQIISIFEETGLEKFDERLIKPILIHIAEHMIGKTVMLSNDTEAEIVKINEDHISRPIVKNTDDIMIDLNLNENLEIKRIC